MGTASAAATTPLNRIPIFMNSPRRESVFSFDIVKLLMLRVIRNGIGLTGVLYAPRGKPCNHVGDFLVRHRLARHVATPVGCPQLGTASDHNRTQSLIADEREKGIVRNRAALCASATGNAVARF